uniref:FCS-type domain-containing protein n=1 Tax=Biomphalaria glabrata TaxID=6526 RepID=A0A2C9L865_BIOGL
NIIDVSILYFILDDIQNFSWLESSKNILNDAVLLPAHLSSTQLISHFPQRKDDQEQQKSPVKLLKCEMCQKVGPASTFNNSRRFCSLTCSRRHSVSNSRRVGIYKSRGTARKRKHILGRKNWRVSKGVRLPFAMASGNSTTNPDNNEDSNTAPVGDEMSSSNSAQDTSSSAASPSRSQDFEMDMEANIPRTDPGKWT